MIEAESMRVVASALLGLILLSNVACAGRQPDSADAQWQPSKTIPGGFRRDLVGDTNQPGPFKYQLKVTAGTRVGTHRHSKEVHVKVLSGSMFIIIGEPLEPSRARHFTTGRVFVVPSNAWHDEWWDEETVMEAEGVGPMETVYKSRQRGQAPLPDLFIPSTHEKEQVSKGLLLPFSDLPFLCLKKNEQVRKRGLPPLLNDSVSPGQ